MGARLPFFGFAAVVGLLAVLVVGSGRSTWLELQNLRRNFATFRTERFHHAELVEARLLDLNETVLRHELRLDPADRTTFEREKGDMMEWLVAQRGLATTVEERELLTGIEEAMGRHVIRASGLMEERLVSGEVDRGVEPVLEALTVSAEPILALVTRLKEAERSALNQFVQDSYGIVQGLQGHLVAAVGLVMLLGLTAARLGYRARIAPLRAEIIESRTRMERQEKLAALGTLAAGVAHEVRNPLTAINVRVHSLKRTLPEGSSEWEDILVIDQEIRRLDRIVRDFLDFARPSPPRLVTISVESLFRRVQSLLATQWKTSSIQLITELPAGFRIRADTQQLEQVLINLVQNAAESIGEAGTITMRGRGGRARLADRVVDAVILEVADTGKGIPREVQARMFDPFFTTKENGTGLGLAIAASIVEKHGGLLQCHTQVGRGTTFAIVLGQAED